MSSIEGETRWREGKGEKKETFLSSEAVGFSSAPRALQGARLLYASAGRGLIFTPLNLTLLLIEENILRRIITKQAKTNSFLVLGTPPHISSCKREGKGNLEGWF